MPTIRNFETAGSAAQLPGNAADACPGFQPAEHRHVDRSAGAQTHSASGSPAILSKAENAGTGQAVCEPSSGILGTPAGADTRSAVGPGALPFGSTR